VVNLTQLSNMHNGLPVFHLQQRRAVGGPRVSLLGCIGTQLLLQPG
jgi:hypothetical protein